VVKQSTSNLKLYDNTEQSVPSGVLILKGGYGTEDDGKTKLPAYTSDGITLAPNLVATLDNFIHMPDEYVSGSPTFLPTDGYAFSDVEYTFKVNHPVLQGKNIITAGCFPSFKLDKQFTNSVFAGDVAVKLQLLRDLLDKPAGGGFPDTANAQECLNTAVAALRSNMTEEGVAAFAASTTICLNQLRDDTEAAIGEIIGIGYDNKKSTFELDRDVQFTSGSIIVSAYLKEANGTVITGTLPSNIASELSQKFTATASLGEVSEFSYDGYQAFTATITSEVAGNGDIKLSFDNKTFSTVNIPTDLAQPSSVNEQILTYQFINTTTGVDVPRRDEGDTSIGSSGGGS
jgi:hypothetical protein